MFPSAKIIVEPHWRDETRVYIPDIVIANGELITDVFEIKFTPHYYAKIKQDVKKLIRYGGVSKEYPTSLDPSSGKYDQRLQTSKELRRHFVVIARDDAAAAWVESILAEVPELDEHLPSFHHWYGRIGPGDARDQEWNITIGKPEAVPDLITESREEKVICALCGTDRDLISNRAGVVCKRCIAEAITSVLLARTSEHSQFTASDRCLLCGDLAVRKGEYAAVRRPYAICAECMKDSLDDAGQGTFLVAVF